MSAIQTTIQNNLDFIRQQMQKAADLSGRKAADIQLVAVSKVQPDEKIEAMLASGQRVFGENRVQEAQGRWSARRRHYPDLQLRLIGPLQTNKVKDALELFDVIETLDRPKLAEKLKVGMEACGKDIPLFIQVNTGEESQKAGILPSELKSFFEYSRQELGLRIEGLMCIPPVDEPAGLHFGLLKTLADSLAIKNISMGMSGDYEKAIRFGATHIRVGSALFGERDYS
jgi:hypothetical protein